MEFSLFATASRPALGTTQPPIQRVVGTLTPGVKWQGCKADHSPPSSAEVMNAWGYISRRGVWLSTATTSLHTDF
jgi:hypothetical protein